jgi:hypothetical protein
MISPFGGERKTPTPPTPVEPTWEELLETTPEKPIDPPEVAELPPTPIEAPIGLGLPNKNVAPVTELSNGLAETEARVAKETAAKITRQEYLMKQAEDLAAFRRQQLTREVAQDVARLQALREGLEVEEIEAGVERLKKRRSEPPSVQTQ